MSIIDSQMEQALSICGPQRCAACAGWLDKQQKKAQIFRFGRRCAVSTLAPNSVFVVSKGVAGLECVAKGGARSITQLLFPGDIVVPAVQTALPGAALIARRPVELLKFTLTSIAEDTAHDARLSQAVFMRLNAQNTRTQLHIAEMSALTSDERVAGFLVEIGCRVGVGQEQALAFELPLSRYDIAAYLALNADTVSRSFSALTSSGTIERSGRSHVSIPNWQRLLGLCPLSEAITQLHREERPVLSC